MTCKRRTPNCYMQVVQSDERYKAIIEMSRQRYPLGGNLKLVIPLSISRNHISFEYEGASCENMGEPITLTDGRKRALSNLEKFSQQFIKKAIGTGNSKRKRLYYEYNSGINNGRSISITCVRDPANRRNRKYRVF